MTESHTTPLHAAEDLLETCVDGSYKGFPDHAGPLRLADLGKQGWNLLKEDVLLPALVVKQAALDHNIDWMQRLMDAYGAVECPHGKTTMAPQILAQQLQRGAWGVTVASVAQMQVYRRHGVGRVLLANALVGEAHLRYIAEELKRDPELDFYSLVDSVAAVETLASAARRHRVPRPFQVLVELGEVGGRSGCPDLSAALLVARAVRDAGPPLSLRGAEGYEGTISGTSREAVEGQVHRFLDLIVETARACVAENLFAEGDIILSAGGTMFIDIVLERLCRVDLGRPVKVVTQTGSYVGSDASLYADGIARLLERSPVAAGLGRPPLPALELWSYVQARPVATKATVGLGLRDTATTYGPPVPLRWFRPGVHRAPQFLPEGHRFVVLHDQHGLMETPSDSPLAVGDMVCAGPCYPCGTFDKWRLVYAVDDAYNVIGGYRTFF